MNRKQKELLRQWDIVDGYGDTVSALTLWELEVMEAQEIGIISFIWMSAWSFGLSLLLYL